MRTPIAWILAFLSLFRATSVQADPAIKLLYTDWTVQPGRVFYQGAVTEQTLLEANTGRLYTIVVGPDGVVYVSDANKNDLLRWTGDTLTLVHHHTTYLRDVAFDPEGRLYFSEATGAAGDGKIYRLDDSGPTLFFTVSLASVDGFWAGHFSFAPDGALYLSSGNRTGASIYRVLAGSPVIFFTDPVGAIAGFDFDTSGNIYYADWFHRIYKVTPGAVRTVALENLSRRFSDVEALTRSVALGPEAGRVNRVALHPTNANVLYAATSSGGIFRSADGGGNWFLRSRGITHAWGDGLLVHPLAPTTVFAVTPAGVFRSADEGLSWTQPLSVLTALPPLDLSIPLSTSQKNPIRYNPADGSIYAAPYCAGLYRSPDGLSWTQIYPASPLPPGQSCVTSIDVSPVAGGTVYITTPTGIWTRVAGAGPWTQIGMEINDADPLELRVAPSDPNRIYVAAMGLDGWPPNTHVWVRATAASTFVRTTATPPWLTWYYAMSLTVHPTDPLRLFFGAIPLYGTSDAATWTWTTCSNSGICGVDYRGVDFDAAGTRLYAAHDQGIFRLDLASNSFTAIENGLVNTQFYDLDVGASGRVYGGTQDKGAHRRLGAAAWQGLPTGGSGDVLDLLAHPTDPLRLFVRTNAEGVRVSNDGGATTTAAGWTPHQGFWNHQMSYDAPSTTLYVGTQFQGVHKSVNDGASFLPANVNIENREIRCLALQPGSSTVVYAGTFTNGIYKTTNGGTWSQLSAFPETGALVLAINPLATRVYAGTKAGVFLSTDGGTSWSASSSGLPTTKVVGELLIDPVCPCLMYAGLGYYDPFAGYGGGIYQSTDGGANWSPLTAADEASLTITSIRIDVADRSRLHIATYGSGVRSLFRDLTPAGGCAC
jgi:WD40 repeat protein